MDILQVSGQFSSEKQRAEFLGAIPFIVTVPQTLQEAKVAKNAYINAMRENACLSNVTTGLGTWQADRRSIELLNGAIALASNGIPPPSAWRTADNINVAITLSDLVAIMVEISAQTQTAYAKSWYLKEQVQAATTIDQVVAIQW